MSKTFDISNLKLFDLTKVIVYDIGIQRYRNKKIRVCEKRLNSFYGYLFIYTIAFLRDLGIALKNCYDDILQVLLMSSKFCVALYPAIHRGRDFRDDINYVVCFFYELKPF